jgi:hypothetical protein
LSCIRNYLSYILNVKPMTMDLLSVDIEFWNLIF